ncbi:MAG: ribokinase [Planctomycetes bacterium]|nr:ribokinase [Planctomycetota bacterium]
MSDSRPRLVVLGSLNLDLVVTADRAPGPGETVLGAGFATHAGGKGANQAVAAARLGGSVRLIGAVGDDAHGRELLESARRADVEVEHVAVRAGVPTGVAAITVDARGENRIVVAPGANATVDPPTVERARAAFVGARAFLAQLETPLDAVLAGARHARAAGATTILNAAPARELSDDVLAAFDVLIVNRGEAELLAGAKQVGDVEALLHELSRRGPRTVVVTLGTAGSLVRSDGRVTRQAAFPIEACDTTAAGDAFVGAFAVAQASGAELAAALRRASAAGALACTRAGAQPSLPTRAELDAFLAVRA